MTGETNCPPNSAWRTADSESPERLLERVRKSIARCCKRANDALQILVLAAESHRLKEMGDAAEWRVFHAECMFQVLQAVDLLKVAMDDLKRMWGVDQMTDADAGP